MSSPTSKSSTPLIALGIVLTLIGLFFWPLLLIGIPLAIFGGMVREAEKHNAEREATRQAKEQQKVHDSLLGKGPQS